jgi:hypothetical protein
MKIRAGVMNAWASSRPMSITTPFLTRSSISGDCASKRCVQDGPARLSEPIQNDPDPVRLKQEVDRGGCGDRGDPGCGPSVLLRHVEVRDRAFERLGRHADGL